MFWLALAAAVLLTKLTNNIEHNNAVMTTRQRNREIKAMFRRVRKAKKSD